MYHSYASEEGKRFEARSWLIEFQEGGSVGIRAQWSADLENSRLHITHTFHVVYCICFLKLHMSYCVLQILFDVSYVMIHVAY